MRTFSTSGQMQMQMTDDGNRILRGALKDLEREDPWTGGLGQSEPTPA
jgi:hypothetical protein